MEYREPLPADCPPPDAVEIVEPRIVYRFVRNNPPTFDDFRSQRAINPRGRWSVSECQARGVSVFMNLDSANEVRQEVENLHGTLICEVVLDEGAGRIRSAGSRSHCTWWPLADYDILAKCRVVL